MPEFGLSTGVLYSTEDHNHDFTSPSYHVLLTPLGRNPESFTSKRYKLGMMAWFLLCPLCLLARDARSNIEYIGSN